MVLTRSLVWVKTAGAELAEVEIDAGRLTASGTAIGADPLPYRLEFDLRTGDDYVTELLTVRTEGTGWRRFLELEREDDGSWFAETLMTGEPLTDADQPLPRIEVDETTLAEALDCDLGLSPMTNTMPVLRHGMHLAGRTAAGPVELLMAWVSVPDLSVRAMTQTYEHVRDQEDGTVVIRYSSGTFTEEITFDSDGLVVDYPAIGRRP
ncbi:MAG: hypothetical protein GEV11_21340 [Streptosporangiales bacterium]|nr:hypothetical protein [Streptosporangiales bacterium]